MEARVNSKNKFSILFLDRHSSKMKMKGDGTVRTPQSVVELWDQDGPAIIATIHLRRDSVSPWKRVSQNHAQHHLHPGPHSQPVRCLESPCDEVLPSQDRTQAYPYPCPKSHCHRPSAGKKNKKNKWNILGEHQATLRWHTPSLPFDWTLRKLLNCPINRYVYATFNSFQL